MLRSFIWTCCLLLATFVHGQVILAGVYTNEDIHKTIDTTLIAPEYGGASALSVDVNDDGVQDIMVRTSFIDGGLWYRYRSTVLLPMNGTSVLGEVVDTCFANSNGAPVWMHGRAAALNDQDTIPGMFTWSDSLLTLARSDHSATMPDGLGTTCFFISPLASSAGYVGLCVRLDADTLLGWLRIGDVGPDRITLIDLGARSISAGISTSYPKEHLTAAPNPAVGHFRLSGLDPSLQVIRMLDVQGRTVREVSGVGPGTPIPVEGLEPGIYVIRCGDEGSDRYCRLTIGR